MLTFIFWLLVIASSIGGVLSGCFSEYGIPIFFSGYFLGILGVVVVGKFELSKEKNKC